MRFLLKASARPSAAKPPSSVASAFQRVVAPATPVMGDAQGRGKAWGQQCSPDCGCVLRIETQLRRAPAASSPTVVRASYHAKRVMAIDADGARQLTPLTTQRGAQPSRPILTKCTCPTLHHLAKRAVDHLPGKTLDRLRNDVGSRSSVALRYTVLRDEVLPVAKAPQKLGMTKLGSSNERQNGAGPVAVEDADAVHEMNATEAHGRCYDLVESALSAMIHERMPAPRKDTHAEAYSPTLGGHFRMYSPSLRNRPAEMDEDIDEAPASAEERELSSLHEAGDWRRRSSPSSYLLFGDEATGSSVETFVQRVREMVTGRGQDSNASRGAPSTREERDEDRPPNTYLQMLDIYGDRNDEDLAPESALDDWLDYVDQMHYEGDRRTTA